jgi:hypothetical protein
MKRKKCAFVLEIITVIELIGTTGERNAKRQTIIPDIPQML